MTKIFLRRSACEKEVNNINAFNKRIKNPIEVRTIKVAVMNPKLYRGDIHAPWQFHEEIEAPSWITGIKRESADKILKKGDVCFLCVETDKENYLEKMGLLRLRE